MSSEAKHHDYHLVDPSPWPLIASFSAMTMFLGLALSVNGSKAAGIPLGGLGLASVLLMMYVWWRDVVREGAVQKCHSAVVQRGLRIGMALFILSEVMFFFAFFLSFFKAALMPVLHFDGDTIFSSETVVPGVWPPAGIETLDPWDIPFLNTVILLLSGTTVTWAHYCIHHGKRKEAIRALAVTIALGVSFTLLQALEYGHATFSITEGVYPSNFYMATGFHGAHVIIGTLFLTVCLVRLIKRQMLPPEGSLGFEFAAWYWHFVDVVWLFLFVCVYVFGGGDPAPHP
jgi:cytochrome c oxidase subunit 3